MPCQDYDSRWDDSWSRKARDIDNKEIKKHTDKLARIACKALTVLEENGIEDLLLLKDDEVREWWQAHKEADRKAQEAREAREHKARIKAEALSKLSDTEKEALGLSKSKRKSQVFDLESYEPDFEKDLLDELADRFNNSLKK